MNPLANRFVVLFRGDGEHEDISERMLNFKEFLATLRVFAPQMRHSDERFKLLFNVFDYDNDGILSESDLSKAVKAMAKGACSDEQIQEVVERTLVACQVPPRDHPLPSSASTQAVRGITYDRFISSCKGLPMDTLLTISFGEGDEDDDEDDAKAVSTAAAAAAKSRLSTQTAGGS